MSFTAETPIALAHGLLRLCLQVSSLKRCGAIFWALRRLHTQPIDAPAGLKSNMPNQGHSHLCSALHWPREHQPSLPAGSLVLGCQD